MRQCKSKPRCQKKIFRIQNIKIKFASIDIAHRTLFTNTPTDLDQINSTYTLSQTRDKHAPATTKEVIVRPHIQWFSGGIATAKRRKAEIKWNKSKSTADTEELKEKHRAVKDLWEVAKKDTVNRTQRNSK